jgi:carbohydrate diacid regulator
MKLVNSLSDTIPNDIGIIDLDGTILAHSDPQITGTSSRAARALVESGEAVSIVPDGIHDSDAFPGVYTAITVDKQLCGVLWVQFETQPVETLLQVCALVSRICAHAIIESVSADYYNIKNYDKNIFLTDWIKGLYRDHRTDFNRKALEYGINPDAGAAAAVLRVYRLGFNRALFYELFDMLSATGHLVLTEDDDFIILFNTADQTALTAQVNRIDSYLAERTPNYLLAVGSPLLNIVNLHESYEMARTILTTYYRRKTGVILYSDCIFDLSLNEVPQQYKDTILELVFGRCAPKDVPEYCSFIQTYVDANGSLKTIAEKLFTHTNTVQYRIERLRQKTGLDLRSVPDAFMLYVTSLWVQRGSRPRKTEKKD